MSTLDLFPASDNYVVLWMLGWVLVSTLVTFTVNIRMCFFPISYIFFCSVLCLYSVATVDESAQSLQPFVATIVFGVLVFIGSIGAMGIMEGSGPRRSS